MNILYLVCEQFVTAYGFRKSKQIRVGVDALIDPKCRPVRVRFGRSKPLPYGVRC